MTEKALAPPTALNAYIQQLHQCLQWDPIHGAAGKNKQDFVEALTEIAALPLDSSSMEIRRLLIVSKCILTKGRKNQEPDAHLCNIIAALSARDVQLKCKAANAVGSLCISRVAGQELLHRFGKKILHEVAKMATRRNQWVQSDAFFVLGWIIVIADQDTLQFISKLLPTVIKCLHRNVILSFQYQDGTQIPTIMASRESQAEFASRQSKAALASSEQASNLRIYALVLLLNFSQRHVDEFADLLAHVLPMLKDLMSKLLDVLPSAAFSTEQSDTISLPLLSDVFESAEVLRLGISLLSVLCDQLESVALQLLKLQMLPLFLKLKHIDICAFVGEAGRQDFNERLEAIIETVLLRR